ncbi:hypothetical protein J6I39_02600 [bacterium]|nr:hypothetical protein [bacterium]
MNILRIIKELYAGKNNLTAQIGLLALLGIAAISYNEILSFFTGNTLYAVFATPTDIEIIIYAMSAIMISIFFIGYIFKFVHESYSEDKIELPSVSLNCFTIFAKFLPLMFIWSIYLFIAIYVFILLFGFGIVELSISLLILLTLLPFINIVYFLFAKNFKYDIKLFNPLIIPQIMQKTFVPVAKLVAQYLLTGFVIGFIFSILLIIPYKSQCSQIVRMISILAIICINIYCYQVLNLAFSRGLTDIIKKNLI